MRRCISCEQVLLTKANPPRCGDAKPRDLTSILEGGRSAGLPGGLDTGVDREEPERLNTGS
jgi:hypothetical protein